MLNRLKDLVNTFYKKIIPDELKTDKAKRLAYLFSFISISLATFLTIFGQLPFFALRNLTQVFQIFWALCLIPLIILDYKRVIKGLLISLCFLSPFVLYLVISLIFKIPSILYQGTTYVFVSAYIFIIGFCFGKYFNRYQFKVFCALYISSALIYALVVFFTKLLGSDFSNPIYAFGSKNSASPIFLCAAIFAFYLFKKRTFLFFVLKYTIVLFFIIIIAVSKARSSLLIIPVIVSVMLFIDIKNRFIPILIVASFLMVIILIFAIPSLYKTLIVDMLFNGKTNVDDIFSGRLTQIVINLQSLKPVLGNGGCYFDVMILSFVCSYGIIGTLSLFPFLSIPVISIILFYKKDKSILSKSFLLVLILFLFGTLFEGYGYIGTGAKVFVLWFVSGLIFKYIEFRRNNVVLKNNSLVNSFVNKIKPVHVLISLHLILAISSITALTVKQLQTKIGSMIVDRLPSTNLVANYNEVGSIKIKKVVEQMCVGQKITFEKDVLPVTCDDSPVSWNTGWIQNPIITVCDRTGEVTANNTGTALLNMYRFRERDSDYIMFPVVQPNQYDFNKLFISTSMFTKSFDYIDSSVNLKIGESFKIYYDSFYLPNAIDYAFESTNNSIASINPNTGIIKANIPGECDVFLKVNNQYQNESLNRIHVNVTNDMVSETTSINLDVPGEWHENVPLEIKPRFKDGEDTHCTILINNEEKRLENNLFIFKAAGINTITILSQNNETIRCDRTINIISNKPTHFSCENRRIKIGEEKTAEDLNLRIHFENGYSKIVEDNDLDFDSADFKNRAWTGKNGLVKDHTTIKAVVKGIITINLVSSIDKDVNASFNIVSSVYSEKEYYNLCNGIGLIVVSLLFSLTMVFSIFNPMKLKWKLIFNTTFMVGSAIIVYLFSKNGIYTIITLSFIIISSIVINTILITKRDKLPIKLILNPYDKKIDNTLLYKKKIENSVDIFI